jgi:hypothetical protein
VSYAHWREALIDVRKAKGGVVEVDDVLEIRNSLTTKFELGRYRP